MKLTIEQVLAWADEHFVQTSEWPRSNSGAVRTVHNQQEAWNNIDQALRCGWRGLEGGGSLARLLAQRRGAYNRKTPGHLTEEMILEWADHFYATSGCWPRQYSGSIEVPAHVSWAAIDYALRRGRRGLEGGSSLALLLWKQRGVYNRKAPLSLAEETILEWADAHKRVYGEWPQASSGGIRGVANETWSAIDYALRFGTRGLVGGLSLTLLLVNRRALYTRKTRPPLTEDTILKWVDAYRDVHGSWPTVQSGGIEGVANETWSAINEALRIGRWGLPGGVTLLRLMALHRDALPVTARPRLTEDQILEWADRYYNTVGGWPNRKSGVITQSDEKITWLIVDAALNFGNRGLPGGISLFGFLARHRGALNQSLRSHLTEELVLAWADDYHARLGRWPVPSSGKIDSNDAKTSTWSGVDNALRRGGCGLPGGNSLARLLRNFRSDNA